MNECAVPMHTGASDLILDDSMILGNMNFGTSALSNYKDVAPGETATFRASIYSGEARIPSGWDVVFAIGRLSIRSNVIWVPVFFGRATICDVNRPLTDPTGTVLGMMNLKIEARLINDPTERSGPWQIIMDVTNRHTETVQVAGYPFYNYSFLR